MIYVVEGSALEIFACVIVEFFAVAVVMHDSVRRRRERTSQREYRRKRERKTNVIVTTCTGISPFLFVARPFPRPASDFFRVPACVISPIEILGPTAAKSDAISFLELRETRQESG